MENLEQKVQEINEKINEIDEKLEILEQKKKDNKDKTEIGMISVLEDGNLYMELLMDEKWFDEEDLDNLSKAVGDIQKVLLRVQEKIEKENE